VARGSRRACALPQWLTYQCLIFSLIALNFKIKPIGV